MSVSAPLPQTETLSLKLAGAKQFELALNIGREAAFHLTNADAVMSPVLMACAIKQMRDALTAEAMSVVTQLAGSSLGFKTDDKTYDTATLRDVVITAVLNGVSIVGNEFNVVAGEFYIAKNGWKRKLKNRGFTRIDVQIGRAEDVREGTPNNKGNRKISAMFSGSASCQKDGETLQVTATRSDLGDFRVEVDAWGASLMDVQTGLRGKAEARLLRKLWGYVCDEPEPDDIEPEGSVIVIEPESQPAPAKEWTKSEQSDFAPDFVAEWKAIAARVGQDAPVVLLARKLAVAKTLDEVTAISSEEAAVHAEGKVGTREHDTFRRYVTHVSSVISGKA